MPEIFSESFLWLVFYFAILAIMTAVGLYVAGVLRADSLQKEPKAEDHLDYFRELNSKGKLSETEFRKIKKRLAFQIVQEEKTRNQSRTEQSAVGEIDPAALIARSEIVFMENGEDTQIAGKSQDGESDETVFGK